MKQLFMVVVHGVPPSGPPHHHSPGAAVLPARATRRGPVLRGDRSSRMASAVSTSVDIAHLAGELDVRRKLFIAQGGPADLSSECIVVKDEG